MTFRHGFPVNKKKLFKQADVVNLDQRCPNPRHATHCKATYTEVGNAGIASLHGKDCSYNPIAFPPSMEVRCNLLGQCICPGMDGSRTTQEQLSRSNCRGAKIRHGGGGSVGG
jgi:hypothetical protein